MATDFDPYRILGVDRGASADDVRVAYERLSAESPAGSERLREVEASYAVLGSEDKRREYDSRLSLRESRGMPAASAEALTLASEPIGYENVPWTMGDIAKALILPLLLVVMNVSTSVATDTDPDDFTESDYIVNYGFAFVLQAAFFGIAYHFSIRKYGGSWRSLGFVWPSDLQWWFPLALLGGALAVLWTYVAILLALGVEGESNSLTEGTYDYVIPIIMLGALSLLVAPLVEEVFFRGFLNQGIAKRWGVTAGIAGSAVFFGMVHASTLESFIVIPVITVIGAIFAWGFVRSGSIYPSIIAHAMFNGIQFGLGFWA